MTLVVLRLIIMQLIDEFVLTNNIFSDKTSNGLLNENLLRSRFESFQLTMKN